MKPVWGSAMISSVAAYIFIFVEFARGQLQVLSPLSARDLFHGGALRAPQGLIPVATSTFGAPTYGESFVAKVLRFEPGSSNYCNGEATYGGNNVANNSFKSLNPDASIAFLVDRGGCSFMEKVFEAEKFGADAVIFIDSPESKWDRKKMGDVIVADNGHGIHVNIPSVVVTFEDGVGLLRFAQAPDDINTSESLTVDFNWEVPKGDGVKFDFWMSNGIENSREFIAEFAPLALAIGDTLTVRPHFYVVGLDGLDESARKLMCYNSDARFCIPTTDNSDNSGASVLREDLRQMCLLESGKLSTVKNEHLWMEYVSKTVKKCHGVEDPTCGDNVLHALGGHALLNSVHECLQNHEMVSAFGFCSRLS
eukprot:GHVH01006688.1.p1 GENE.GHVH01006688.1~~GHVH01006688.1.p1  ORF type:complete len:366 (+),score=59.62 GHVH01006688.1:54-1151(+)